MTKFKPAYVSHEEIVGTAKAWFKLWQEGDENTINVVGKDVTDEAQAFCALVEYCKKTQEGSTFINDLYQVHRVEIDSAMVHLSIRRLDRSHIRDWRHNQQIKNELVGEECEAIELYPAESRLVDNANQYHIWCWSDPSFRLPIGWGSRMVSDSPVGKGQQRELGDME